MRISDWSSDVCSSDLIQSSEFRASLSGSLTRLGFGYGAALLFGVGFGLAGGVLFFFGEVLKSAIIILQSFPPIAWVPLFLLMLAFANIPILVLIALAPFFPYAPSECIPPEADTDR